MFQIDILKQILLSPVLAMFIISKNIDYVNVKYIWTRYLENDKNVKNIIRSKFNDYETHLILSILSFHKETEEDHAILYYNHSCSVCLVLAKIEKKYFNVKIPQLNLKDRRRSFFASYCL